MELKKELFGKTAEGQRVERFLLSNGTGLSVSVISLGCILTSVLAPDRNGEPGEVTLGFDRLEPYLAGHPYFGAVVGRFANRIAGGRFALEGRRYTLACNEGGINHLHGGVSGFDKKVWEPRELSGRGFAGVELHRVSPDGEEGYPGNLDITVRYTLDENDELAIEYEARSDHPTPINLTNHAYWNLAGAGSGTIMQHELTLSCSRFLPVDERLIPTGQLRSVAGTPMDFREGKPIGRDFRRMKGGYDHCLVIDRNPCARLYDPSSGRGLELSTTQPGVQLYTGNFLNDVRGAGGKLFRKHGALCLETEAFPDAPNHPEFPSAILRPGELYRHRTSHRFFHD
jgi:aldose 1-epimerase